MWQRSALVMVFIVIGLIIVEAIDAATHYDLDSAGIEPRRIDGLDGIVWSPFLHANWGHLWTNLAVGVVLGFLLLLARRFLFVTAVVWITSGLGVWLFAPSGSVTVGASGVIFGWLAYLLVRGLFNRNLWQILGGLVLLLVYGSVLWGVLPTDPTVSWQGHLFGAIGGVLAAWFLADRDRRRRSPGNAAAGGSPMPGVSQ
ncbi:rhomboid family intramembrane serine protease [Gordonia polyisoprenivorans]|uniref:rhomboid family intramembrane serine protease n=1 Tax=Gordonia polyisoprenivorans TaxID=84595 RepID=UPI001B8D40E5|nr:rhomboid family intramembrane serine protease [Gordonia polyisoprenivorans]QUD80960.1 rhomboid family intramembrane serine protease [Gordonia polyisoprenivorans]